MRSSLPALLAATAALGATTTAHATAMPPPKLIDEPWVVKQVSRDGRTLAIWSTRGGCDPKPRATVAESARAVAIQVRHAPPQNDVPCPAIMVYERLRVRLDDPIAGRDLRGQSLTAAPLGPTGRVPRIVGLRADDARFALRAHGIRVRGQVRGTVRAQDPRPGTPIGERRNVTLDTGAARMAIPPLEPVRFRTVARGDGSSSAIKRRTGLVIRGERRWGRVWRKLWAGTQPRPPQPLVDFSRHMLLVAVQGRQPSGGHRTKITGVGNPGGRLIVDVDDRSPGAGCVTTGVITSPYHVVRVRRSDDPVTFQRHAIERDC